MPGKRNTRLCPPIGVSQNFLTSRALIERLLRLTNLCQTDRVWDIGAGKGHLTAALARRCAGVTAVEIDEVLCRRLHEKFAELPGVRIIRGDFLRQNLPKTGPYKVFSNIPFSLTSSIVQKLTRCANPPKEMWLIMQKQAALRYCGAGGETAASLSLKPFFDLRIEYYFRREDFHPRPGVDCVLLHLAPKDVPDIPHSRAFEFARFVALGRENGTRGIKRMLSHERYKRALREADIPKDFTPANLLYVQWLCLLKTDDMPGFNKKALSSFAGCLNITGREALLPGLLCYLYLFTSEFRTRRSHRPAVPI